MRTMKQQKSPWFPFYGDDFIGGTVAMTMAERGLYITLLAIQWGQGYVEQDDFDRLGSAIVSPSGNPGKVLAKFAKGEDGLLRNERLEEIRRERDSFRSAKSASGRAGAAKKWQTDGKPMASGMAKDMAKDSSPQPQPQPQGKSSHTPSSEAEEGGAGGKVLAFREIPDERTFRRYAEMIGLPKWRADDEWLKLERDQWCLPRGQAMVPIASWQRHLDLVRSYWERDGRPMEPPKRVNGNGSSSGAAVVDRVSMERELSELTTSIRNLQPEGLNQLAGEDAERMRVLKARRKELREKLGRVCG